MGIGRTAGALYRTVRDWFAAHVRSPSRLAMLANTGATIVWTHLPFYPLLILWMVGRPIWPGFVIYLTLPAFFCVPLVSRRHPTASRILFTVAGIANTLLATKAFGLRTDVGWYLLPCLLIASTFFLMREWRISAALSALCVAAAALLPHLGAPLHMYTSRQTADFASLNHWCVGSLAAYLVFIAARYQLRVRERA